MIPCICLRNDPSALEAPDWRSQIAMTLGSIISMAPFNATSARCRQIIFELCGRYLDNSQLEQLAPEPPALSQDDVGNSGDQPALGLDQWVQSQPVGESPQTQINNVFSMMWPNVPPMEAADVVMGDEAGWMEFLRAGSVDGWTPPNPNP